MKSDQPLVSVIIVHYNETKATLSLLDDLARQTYTPLEVVVMDNNSMEDPLIHKNTHNRIDQLAHLSTNHGYAGAINEGVKMTHGSLFLFLNNDLELPVDAVSLFVKYHIEYPQCGIICPVIKNDEKIEFAGYTSINPFTGRNKAITNLPYNSKDILSTAYTHGAAMFTSRAVFNSTNGLPEIYFLYYEEIDWSEQVKKAGYTLMVAKEIVIKHKGSLSVSRKNGLKTYYMTRNRILFMRRNQNGFALIIFILLFTFIAIPGKIITYFLSGKTKEILYFCRGILWHITHRIT